MTRSGKHAKHLSRRQVITGGAAISLSLAACSQSDSLPDLPEPPDAPPTPFAELEVQSGGRLGAALLNTQDHRLIGHRLDERFGMCSTFKVLLAGLILREADAGRLSLDQFVPYSEDDMVFYAPVTTENLSQGGMTIGALTQTAQITSDNVAANLLLRQIGGPAGFTAKMRELGDEVTRLDRWEPEMNLVPPGEIRDTTSPAAMAHSLKRFLFDDVLLQESRAQLLGWMVETKTGLRRIRAGLPKDWKAGDKTGTGIAPEMANKYNDVAVMFPPGRPAYILSTYYEADGYDPNMRDQDMAVLAEAGRLAAKLIKDGLI